MMKGGREFVLKSEVIHFFTMVGFSSCLKHSCLNEVEKENRKTPESEEEKEGEGGFVNLKRGFPHVRTMLILEKGI